MTPKTFVNTLSILHLAFFGSMLGFAIIVYIIIQNHTLDLETIDTTFILVVLFLTLFGVFGGNVIKKMFWQQHIQKTVYAKSWASIKQLASLDMQLWKHRHYLQLFLIF